MAYAVDGQRYDSKFDYITQGFQQEAELNPTDKETTKAEEDQGNLVRKRHQIQDEREGPNPTFPPKDNPDAVPTDFLARRQRKAEGFFDKIRLAQNEFRPPANENMKDVTPQHPPIQIDVLGQGMAMHSGPGPFTRPSEYQKTREPANENVRKNLAERMMELHPDMLNYYRAFYKQKGGDDWETWQESEAEMQVLKEEKAGRFLDVEHIGDTPVHTIIPLNDQRLGQAVRSAEPPPHWLDKAAMKFEDIVLAPGNWMAKGEQKLKDLLRPKKKEEE